MLSTIIILLAAIVPYLIGSINFSIIISKRFKGEDIRKSGSGNAGATNMLRTYGKGWAVLTLLLDVLKGSVGVWLGMLLCALCKKYVILAGSGGVGISVSAGSYDIINAVSPYFMLIGALFAVIGHNFPVFFGFKGGKGVAASLGVLLALDYRIGLIVLVFAVAIMAITRYVSLGSVMAAIIYVAVSLTNMIYTNSFSAVRFCFDILLAALLIVRHRKNIKRLLAGEENKLGKKK